MSKELKIVVENDSHVRVGWFNNEEDLKRHIDYTFQVEDDFEPFDHTYIIDDKYYSPCSFDIKENILVVEEFEIKGSKEDETNEDVLTCPVCGYVYQDCWEFSKDSDDNLECPMCKSILEYEREYEVTYTTKVKKLATAFKLENKTDKVLQ